MRYRNFLLPALTLLFAIPLGMKAAWSSPGCDRVNDGAFNKEKSDNLIGTVVSGPQVDGFVKGDVIEAVFWSQTEPPVYEIKLVFVSGTTGEALKGLELPKTLGNGPTQPKPPADAKIAFAARYVVTGVNDTSLYWSVYLDYTHQRPEVFASATCTSATK